jgi:Fe-S cluster biogenesis protein NfuA
VADVIVNVELFTGLGLPYEPGAESALAPDDAAAFAGVSAIAGTPLSLAPGFDLPIEELADFLAAARQGGVEPPDLFAWYRLACPEEVAEAVVTALQALPFVLQASIQPSTAPAGWEVVTDPATVFQRYLRMPPAGVNAYAAWQVPGGSGLGARVADVEHGWDLQHPDLLGADVARLTFLPPVKKKYVDHGTQALGIIGAQPNGSVLTGIASGAALAVAHAGSDAAAAIARAARHVGRGGIVLIELGQAIPERAHEDTGHIPLEHDPFIRATIMAATALGVLVVEPAGNGSVNLDIDPRYPDLRLPPMGIDSGALMVAASDCDDTPLGPTNEWRAASFTTGGARVNCFAPGAAVFAPITGNPAGFTADFRGTSAASAIIAGVAAVVQGVAIASSRGRPLPSTELHARLADPQFGAGPPATSPTNPQLIGVMPDLEKLLEGLGVPRIPPLTAARGPGDRVVLMRSRLRDVNQLEILEGSGITGAWLSSPTSGDSSRYSVVCGHPVALHHTVHAGLTRIDAVTPSDRGGVCHRPFVLDVGLGLNDPWRAVTLPTSELEAFKISAPMTAVGSGNRLLVSGLAENYASLILIAERQAGSQDVVPATIISDVMTDHEPVYARPDPSVRFEYPPAIFDHGGSVVLVGVDRDGWIRFAQWSLDFGWTPFEMVARGLDPGQPPALASDGPALHVVGVDSASGEVREVVRSAEVGTLFQWSALRAIAANPFVTWGLPLEPASAISMASDGAGTLMAMALNASGQPMATVRFPGLDWSPLFFVPCLTAFVARGGLALASPGPGVFVAAASDASGLVHTARWTLAGWMPFLSV